MPLLPNPRTGRAIFVLKRPVRFSFWPMYKGPRRYGLQSTLFALDPWVVIQDSIKERCSSASKSEAICYLAQANDFHKASVQADVSAARPLLLYYCFMNLVKAFVLTAQSSPPSLEKAQHGLCVDYTGPNVFADAKLSAYVSNRLSPKGPNLFDEFHIALTGTGLSGTPSYALPHLLPQILTGHRLWADAAAETERFISVHEIQLNVDTTGKLWTLSLSRKPRVLPSIRGSAAVPPCPTTPV